MGENKVRKAGSSLIGIVDAVNRVEDTAALISQDPPIHKFNGGEGATLCKHCRVIITTGLSDDRLCATCTENAK